MKFPDRETVKRIREKYPVGTRVELLHMNDPQAPPVGTEGTVWGVDDTASIMVHWDNGSGLNVVFGEDQCIVVQPVKTICYGKIEVWKSRTEAERCFLEAIIGSDGSERDRYTKIYTELKMGMALCTDED